MTTKAEYESLIQDADLLQARAIANDLNSELEAARKVINMANEQIQEARAVLNGRLLRAATPIMASMMADPSLDNQGIESIARVACEAGQALLTEIAERYPVK